MKKPVEEMGRRLENLRREGFHHVGHSTHWIVLGGARVLTDPWISEPANSCLSHRPLPSPLPIDPDVILITHRHEDHFDPVALGRLNRKAEVVVPSEQMAEELKRLGYHGVHVVNPGQVLENICGLTIDVVLGKHDVFEVCYRVEAQGNAFFFGGDSMLTPEIKALARSKPAPFTILPGERSSLLGKRFVMTPGEAVMLAGDFRAKKAVLSHHESYVSKLFPVGWLITLPQVPSNEFPDWFIVPKPGDYIPFPWDQMN